MSKQIPVMKMRKVSVTIAVVALISLIATYFVFGGFNRGIDFESGYSVRAAISGEDVSIDRVRGAFDNLGSVSIQSIGNEENQVFRIRLGLEENDTQETVEKKISEALDNEFGQGNAVLEETNFVGPKFSSTLLRASVVSVVVALALILCYIWIRFRFAFAISSILALLHDVIILLGFIALFRFEFSSTTVAAILTTIGYSLNNTIVIFDRVRENVKLSPEKSLADLADLSVSQSWSRTMMSSLTTLLAVVPLAILSTGDIKYFAIEMIIGVVVGTFSSNFLSPVFLNWITAAQKRKKK